MVSVAAVVMVLSMPQQADRWEPLARVIEEAVGARAFPGAVVAVGRRDTVLFMRAFGRTAYEATGGAAHRPTAVTESTVYDLASLTKVVGLTAAIMMLVDEGRVDLEAPVSSYVPAFGRERPETVRVRDLLTHSSGLPAWQPYYRTAQSRADVFAMAAAEPLEAAVGSRMEYSDVGAIVLTAMVEAVSGERIDRFLGRRLFGPLGMRNTRFRPPRSWSGRIAPTEMDTGWRNRLVHGEVHDDNAARMDGVSGHAGLFGTAGDLVLFAQMMLRGSESGEARGEGSGNGAARVVSPHTIRLFTRVQDPALSRRAMGWETPDGENSAGSRLSPRAFGHTGFTGTSMWMDPELDLFVILLSNRVHPTRENNAIRAVRRRVADLAVEISSGP